MCVCVQQFPSLTPAGTCLSCVLQLDPAAFVDTCLYLFCSLSPGEREAAVCDTLASYTRECAQQHVIIMWRTDALCGNDPMAPPTRCPSHFALTDCLCLQVVCVPEDRCSPTVFLLVLQAVLLHTPLFLLHPWASAGRSAWGGVSVYQASSFTKDSVSKETSVPVSIADAATRQVTGFSRDATAGEFVL